MSSSSDAKPEAVFKFGEEVFTLTPPEIEEEIHYVNFLERRHVEKVIAKADSYGGHFTAALGQANRDCTSGMFEWGEREWSDSLFSDVCARELCYLCLRRRHTKLDRVRFLALWKAQDSHTASGRENAMHKALLGFFRRPNSTDPAAPPAAG
jgi:hypothetical protein